MNDAAGLRATVEAFIDCINRGDLAGLVALMSEDHRLEILDEPHVVGRGANAAAWGGYFSAFPHYVIHPHHMDEGDGEVVILGHTTGSHLGLSDAAESELLVVWVARGGDGMLTSWRLHDDRADAHR